MGSIFDVENDGGLAVADLAIGLVVAFFARVLVVMRLSKEREETFWIKVLRLLIAVALGFVWPLSLIFFCISRRIECVSSGGSKAEDVATRRGSQWTTLNRLN